MTAFIEALRAQDREQFLSFFSPTTPWRYISTIVDPPQISEVGFEDLRVDLERRTGWYETLFDAGGDDCFRDWVMGDEGTSWRQTGPDRFVRWEVEGMPTVYVDWRREGDSWFISAIAEPSA